MPLLYFWRYDNYRRDLDYGVGFHLNQRNATLHDIELGDSLWAFTRAPGSGYALAAELIATAKTYNQQGYRYGRYRLWGDLKRSRYFKVEGQPDLAPMIRRFSIRTGVADGMLGRAFQGQAAVRRISEYESQTLRNWASTLSREPRARLVPEERLEALLISEDPAAVSDLLQSEAPGVAVERLAYLRGTATVRNRGLVKELNAIYDGRCQICELHARNEFGVELCEAHHLQWLSRGGEDEISNLVLLCPTHHRAVHRADAPFDWSRDAFVLPHRLLPLALRSHTLTQG